MHNGNQRAFRCRVRVKTRHNTAAWSLSDLCTYKNAVLLAEAAASQRLEAEVVMDAHILKLRRHVERLQERIKQRARCRFLAKGEA